MSKPTFEQALQTVLANCHLSRILEGDESSYNWRDALDLDRKAIETIIDMLCEDLTKLTERKIRRFTKLKWSAMIHNPPAGGGIQQFVFDQLSWSINHFLKRVFSVLRSDQEEGLLTYPIDKIRWNKHGVTTVLPDSMGQLRKIKLFDPDQITCDSVEQPKHIIKLLRKCEGTHFDYQPYILRDEKGCKILALRLGCDWHDLAIATWEPQSFPNLNYSLFFFIFLAFSVMGAGLWFASTLESCWFRIPIMTASAIVGIIGGLLTSFLTALLFKPLKV